MIRNIALTFVFLSAAAGAFAETPMVDTTPFKSTMTREQVQAALQQARPGAQTFGEGYDPQPAFQSTRSRAEVQGEFIAAREKVSALTGEDSGSHYLMAHDLPRTAVGPQLASLPADAE